MQPVRPHHVHAGCADRGAGGGDRPSCTAAAAAARRRWRGVQRCILYKVTYKCSTGVCAYGGRADSRRVTQFDMFWGCIIVSLVQSSHASCMADASACEVHLFEVLQRLVPSESCPGGVILTKSSCWKFGAGCHALSRLQGHHVRHAAWLRHAHRFVVGNIRRRPATQSDGHRCCRRCLKQA